MMAAMQNAMRLQALRAMAGQAAERVGQVVSFEPAAWAVRVELQPEGIHTGWLPLCSPWIGNGWGLFAAPSVGDMVTVSFFGADLEAGFVVGRLWNDTDRPLPVASGELWVVHASGQFVKLTNDGKLSLSDGHGATIALNGDGTISSAGAWNHAGTFTATGDVTGSGTSLHGHKHGGVATGGGQTGTPV